MRPLLLIAALLLVTVPAAAQPLPLPPPRPRSSSPAPTANALRGHVDWQAHPAMDVPYRFFGRPFRELLPKRKLSSRHMLRQTVYAPYLRESGVRVFVAGAMAAEKAGSRRQAFRLIEEQLQVVADFVDDNRDDFALARTPAEARRLLTTTDKIVVVHSIEGMHRVLESPADAEHWARKGVMLATLVHLRDDEFGGSGLNRGVIGAFMNLKGVWRDVRNRRRGLTDQGKAAIVWLADAGILVDLTHMHPDAVDDALGVCRANGIPPVVTHGQLSVISDTQRGFTPEQIKEVYRLGGTFALPASGESLGPHEPTVKIPDGFREGTLDAFQLHAQTLASFLRDHAGELLGRPGVRWSQLSEAERTRLSFGWSSDWNGFLDHSRATHDRRAERKARRKGEALPSLPGGRLEIDTLGLAHPGLLPQYWQRLEQQGLDLDPLLRAPEVFVDLWDRVAARR